MEVIAIQPPCEICTKLFENVKKAVADAGVEAEIKKRWILSEDVLREFGLLLSPAMVIGGVVVSQGRLFKTEEIVGLLEGG
ncbi:MAG: thioredoxin family protein [Deltaproteobacteria bacterium]|nr:thioredoxin family protein [Deltaproteobacteria bacterium]